jgi:ABC-type transport system involved in multi-copper enzyme maturation permease subunit
MTRGQIVAARWGALLFCIAFWAVVAVLLMVIF